MKMKLCMHRSTSAALIILSVSISFLSAYPNPYHSLYLFNSQAANSSIADHLYNLTQRPHSAASQANSVAAHYVLSTFSSYGFKTHIVSYNVSLSFPLHRSLTLIPPPPHAPTQFDLRQQVYEGDPYADAAKEVLPTFHAYAKSGDVSGPVVYVNYGRVEDYETLRAMGVNISATVALAKYGKIYRGDIVSNAYDAGAQGVVIYTDRNDFGGDAKWFPHDKWMPPTGVQIGSVYTGVGDPTTPGWASADDCERLSDEAVEKDGGLAKIPSLPISATDADPILKSIGGQVAKDDWQAGLGSSIYRIGPGPGILNLSYTGKQAIASIQNVFGVIQGAEEPDRFVILGNHRDAWTFGAADPNSGTAALLELARRLGKLQKKGWRPRRTIILCNWDAEEYGLIGSTEWVEENREMLASGAVAYLNVDVAVCGAGFQPTATPQLDNIIQQAARKVQDPENPSQTVYDSWADSSSNGTLGRLGSGGSDFEAFVQHVGIPAANLQFGTGYPVYHSLYDDFVWMKKFGDPMFQRHVAVASIWGLVALRLADEEILPFNYASYVKELQVCTENLEDRILQRRISLQPLFKSIEKLNKAATKIAIEIEDINEKDQASMDSKGFLRKRAINDRLMMTERAFTDSDGLSGKTWYKHLVYGRTSHNRYGSKCFPGIENAIENATNLNTTKTWHLLQHEIYRVSRAVTQASLVLSGELT